MNHSLLDVPGIGPATARSFTEAGFTSVASIANGDLETLARVQGVGPRRAASLRTEAERLLARDEKASASVPSDEASTWAKRADKRRRQAKQLRRQARALTKKGQSTKSKKKRKKRLAKAAELETAAQRARRRAKKADRKAKTFPSS